MSDQKWEVYNQNWEVYVQDIQAYAGLEMRSLFPLRAVCGALGHHRCKLRVMDFVS